MDIRGDSRSPRQGAQRRRLQEGEVPVSPTNPHDRLPGLHFFTIQHGVNLELIGGIDKPPFSVEITGALPEHRNGVIYAGDDAVGGAFREILHVHARVAHVHIREI